MITEGSSDQSLPYLYVFPIYITNPNETTANSNSTTLYKKLFYAKGDWQPFRIDVYFLPNASIDDCQAHYLAEKAARGSIAVQMEAMERGDPPKNAGGLPGMVPSYLKLPTCFYNDLLVISDRNWVTDGVFLVLFNPPPIEECGVYKDELEDYPSTSVTRMEVDMDGYKDDSIQGRLGRIMNVVVMHWQCTRAVELGYKTW